MRHRKYRPDAGRDLVFFLLGAWSVLALQCLL